MLNYNTLKEVTRGTVSKKLIDSFKGEEISIILKYPFAEIGHSEHSYTPAEWRIPVGPASERRK